MLALIGFMCLIFASYAFGQDNIGGVVIPDADPLYLLVELFKNHKAMGLLGAGSAAILSAVQILKKYAPDFKFKKLAVAVLSVLYALLMHYTASASWVSAAIAAFVTGGGAIFIYEVFKDTVGKKPEQDASYVKIK
jgi:hypothetical protein